MILLEGPHILYAEVSTPDDAMLLMNFKMHVGWEVLSLPFPTNYEMVDTGEETTEAQPRTWTFLMHRMPPPLNRIMT